MPQIEVIETFYRLHIVREDGEVDEVPVQEFRNHTLSQAVQKSLKYVEAAPPGRSYVLQQYEVSARQSGSIEIKN